MHVDGDEWLTEIYWWALFVAMLPCPLSVQVGMEGTQKQDMEITCLGIFMGSEVSDRSVDLGKGEWSRNKGGGTVVPIAYT